MPSASPIQRCSQAAECFNLKTSIIRRPVFLSRSSGWRGPPPDLLVRMRTISRTFPAITRPSKARHSLRTSLATCVPDPQQHRISTSVLSTKGKLHPRFHIPSRRRRRRRIAPEPLTDSVRLRTTIRNTRGRSEFQRRFLTPAISLAKAARILLPTRPNKTS